MFSTMKFLNENLIKIDLLRILDNIHDTLVIAGCNNPIIHSNHGTEYSSYSMKDLHNKFTFHNQWVELENHWTIDRQNIFFSILKQKHLKGMTY